MEVVPDGRMRGDTAFHQVVEQKLGATMNGLGRMRGDTVNPLDHFFNF